jgi:hypothetical protein
MSGIPNSRPRAVKPFALDRRSCGARSRLWQAGPSRPSSRPHPYQAHSRDAFLLVRRGRPAQRSDGSDRGCPLHTGVVRLMWHANGTTGEERPGAGGEVEALRPPARSPLFAGASNRHHLPTMGRPTPLFLPGRFAEPVLAPGALADSMPKVKKAGGSPVPTLNGVTAGFGCSCQVVEVSSSYHGRS